MLCSGGRQHDSATLKQFRSTCERDCRHIAWPAPSYCPSPSWCFMIERMLSMAEAHGHGFGCFGSVCLHGRQADCPACATASSVCFIDAPQQGAAAQRKSASRITELSDQCLSTLDSRLSRPQTSRNCPLQACLPARHISMCPHPWFGPVQLRSQQPSCLKSALRAPGAELTQFQRQHAANSIDFDPL